MSTIRNTFQVPLSNPLKVALQNVRPRSQHCFSKSLNMASRIENTLDSNTSRTKRVEKVNDKIHTIPASYQDEVTKPSFFKSDQIGAQCVLNSLANPIHNANTQGLGIIKFLEDKHLLITGGTGFLGKVLVEKILRIQPKVGKIYLLIKAKDTNHARRRLHEELIQSPLFSVIQTRHRENYENFMQQKVIPLVGDVGSYNLGLNNDTIDFLHNKLNIIVHSAATTTFDEQYDVAININTEGACRVVEFSKSCPNIQLLMHVSTAFVNAERCRVACEKTFKVGCSISNEKQNQGQVMKPDIDFDLEKAIIHEKRKSFKNDNVPLKSKNDIHKGETINEALKALGIARSKHFGWQDTYAFTKAMGEMMIDSKRDNVPTVIVRPSVVESSYKEPFPGWIEGNRMIDPIIISYGKGQIRGFPCDPSTVFDVVPVDMVVNSMLAAMAKHASKPGLEVYHMTSSSINPLFFSDLKKIVFDYYQDSPFTGNDGKPISTKAFRFYQNIEEFIKDFSHVNINPKGSPNKRPFNPTLLKQYIQKATYLANIYHPYAFYSGRFDSSKTQQLLSELSNDERILFGFNVSEIDWEAYMKKIHIPGLRKHVLKGRGSNM